MEKFHNFDEIINRRGTDSKKYSLYPDDVIPMWIADSDFKSPQPVVEALVKRMQTGVYGYTPTSERLKRAAAHWQKIRFGWDVNPSAVEYIPGVISGVISAVRAFSHPGDNIVVQSPCYPPFSALAEHNGRHLLRNRLIEKNGRFEIDFDDFEAKIADPRTKLFILCNPQNPTGRVYTREELTHLGELCLKYHVIVLADEIHADIVFDQRKHIPFASLSSEFAMNCVSFMNPSKTFNVPGFRTAAFISCNPVLKEAVHQIVVDNKAIGENICGTLALCTAYEECGYYADQLVAYLQSNRDYAEKRLGKIKGIVPNHLEGTYLMWLDCRELEMSQKELDCFFVERAKVGLNSGTTFEPECDGFLRMNIACPRATLVEAINRIEEAVNSL
ncbi:MAG: MalY/PatB family protein [Pyramidobacter sp.]|jgi:cystathionine beta-lyase